MMDYKNQFVTKNIYYYSRLDYLVGLVGCLVLMYLNYESINIWVFILILALPDVIGYYPAAMLYYLRPKSSRRRVPVVFYYIYNLSHGVFLNTVCCFVWSYYAGGLQFEMLAFPIHLCIDRGVFGLFYKSRKISFVPVEHGLYSRFKNDLENEKTW